MSPRLRHPKKSIEAALQYAESKGWRIEKAGKSAHAWGRAFCPDMNRGSCQLSIWSTPHNDENHARQIRKRVDSCPHYEEKS